MSHAQIESRIAGLADPDPPDPDDESVHRISGIAIGAGDVTNGLHGKKYWGADELQEAAASLIGTPVKALHSEQEVGEIVDAGYLPDRGLVYEADLTDAELAKGVDSGRLTVSIEASHHNGGSVETPRGKAMAATGISFTGMAIVQRGAAPSATAESGEAAALSPAEIHDALAGDDVDDTDDAGDGADRTEAALADIAEVDIGDVIAWRTGNGTLAYGKVRGSIESGSYDGVLDVDRRVTAPAILAVRYRPGQGNTWESDETQIARNPGSVTVLENFPAAPAQEPTQDASARAYAADAVDAVDADGDELDEGDEVPSVCRECGERERTFNTMRCPTCHSDMTDEDHPPLATAPDEEIEAWREQQAAAAAIPYEPTNVSVEEVTADDGPGFTDDEWDGDDVIASLPNPSDSESDSEEATDVLDRTMAVVPADDDARDAKSNWKAPFRDGVDAPVNTRALVAIDGALSGARGGFDGLSEETESTLSEWTESMLEAAPDDLYGANDAETEQSETAANASPAADDGTGPEDTGSTDADADGDSTSDRDAAAASRETDMGDDDNTNPDVTELKARLSEKTDRIDDLEAELSELRDENETLEARAEAVDEAEGAFAAALAEHVPRDAEALQADLSLSQMRDWLDDIDEASVEDAAAAEADVRSGAGSESAALSESERERKQELEAKLSGLEDKEGMLAEKERERVEAELADLTGGAA
ncbi:hypothetical protein DJ71_22095 [Halorubrum sp. E3]|nr:hypothetical protein DJ71_22095 [Halorubrum sp. E3]